MIYGGIGALLCLKWLSKCRELRLPLELVAHGSK